MVPTSTNVMLYVRTKVPANTQAIVLFATDDGKINAPAKSLLSDAMVAAAERLLKAKVARGSAKEVVFDILETAGELQRVYVIGLGSAERLTVDVVRAAAASACRALVKHRIRRVSIVPPTVGVDFASEGPAGAGGVVSGVLLAAFKYVEHKGTGSSQNKESDDADGRFELTILSTAAEQKGVAGEVERARNIADGQNYARTIAFRPGNDVNPPRLAAIAQGLAKETGLTARVFDEKQLAKLGMGGILAVGAGSPTPPRLIALEYDGRKTARSGAKNSKASAPVLLVGKAITFDTGGISIKPADRMQLMVFDKCGGTTVLGTMYAIAKLKLPVHVVGIIASAENHVSGNAYRPGDILKMYNGVTVEVTNTDAEGRLVLGDAISWGIETYKPRAVVDLATLTGACVVALGHTYTGAFANNESLFHEVAAAAKFAGEKLWRLPLDDEYKEQLKSVPADIVNSAGRWGGACTAAAFLNCFVPDDTPWLHLDIAPTADTERDLPYYTKGATAWGVRTLVEWVARLKN